MMSYLAKCVAVFLYKRNIKLEKDIGYRLVLKNIPDSWINGVALIDMTKTWQRAAIRAQGLNYFTIGAVANGLSSRYDPTSPMYQAWFGGYVVRFQEERSWSAKEHVLLGVADQKKWLAYYGDPRPMMEFLSIDNGEDVTIGRYKTKLYYWTGLSHSDVGNKNNRLLRPIMHALAAIMNKSNNDLKLVGEIFVPKWNNNLGIEPYCPVDGYGYVAVIGITPKIRAVLYAGSVVQEEEIKNAMKSLLLQNIDIQKL